MGDCRGESEELLYLGVMRHKYFEHFGKSTDTLML